MNCEATDSTAPAIDDHEWDRADDLGREQMLPLVYPELRRIAAGYLRRERRGHTLQPTALVHEAFMRLSSQRKVDWENRAQFVGLAAIMMRRVLANHARSRAAAKRDADAAALTTTTRAADNQDRKLDLLAVHEALVRLASLDPRKSRIVDLKFFGGLTTSEISQLTGLSTATVEREWTFARGWLQRAMSPFDTAALAPAIQAIAAEALDSPNSDIGPYRLIRKLGRGGMGVVYLAASADRSDKRRVAIKLVQRSVDTDAGLSLFRRERQILARLRHPNIPRLLGAGVAGDGRPYVVMEYVEGAPIDDYCDRHRLPIPARLQLFRSVCAAVAYVHTCGVVHRDLKPANILVTPFGEPKLLDFGVAGLIDGETDDAVTEWPGGRAMTPDYASPEQVAGSPVTPLNDVYSLGLVLYELLAGRHAVADGRRSLVQGRCGGLDTIVLKALHATPARRYKSVARMSADILGYLETNVSLRHNNS